MILLAGLSGDLERGKSNGKGADKLLFRVLYDCPYGFSASSNQVSTQVWKRLSYSVLAPGAELPNGTQSEIKYGKASSTREISL
jgi:hypothetical protein